MWSSLRSLRCHAGLSNGDGIQDPSPGPQNIEGLGGHEGHFRESWFCNLFVGFGAILNEFGIETCMLDP